MMETLVHPIAVYSVMLAGFAALLTLHVSVVRQLSAMRKAAEDELGANRLEFSRLRAELTESLAGHEWAGATAAAAAGGWTGTSAPLNVSKRSQALRLSRRGQAPERIAAALGLTRREVELLLKVQRSVAGAA